MSGKSHHDRRDKRWGSDPSLGAAVGDPKQTIGFLREFEQLVLFRLNVIELRKFLVVMSITWTIHLAATHGRHWPERNERRGMRSAPELEQLRVSHNDLRPVTNYAGELKRIPGADTPP